MPRFIYKEQGSGRFKVSVARDDDDKYGDVLCEISERSDPDSFLNHWVIISTDPYDYLDGVSYQKFDSKETAAKHYWHLRTSIRKIIDSHPLPEDMMQYLSRKARSLREEKQHLESRMIDIVDEMWSLNKFANKFGVQHLTWDTEDSDTKAAVRDLCQFEVVVNNKSIPVLCEGVAYDLFGKEDGRTFLALTRKICNMLAPGVIAEERL